MKNPRYPSLTWPWVGLLLCLALLGQEYLQLATGPNAPLTAYRVTLMAVGVTSLALILLPPRRIGYALGCCVCLGLMAYALYLQYVLDLEPCPLCLQSLPKDQVPSCGMSLNYMLESLPMTDVVRKVFEGSGECAEKGWEFLHLSIAGWTLVFFVAMIAATFALIRRD